MHPSLSVPTEPITVPDSRKQTLIFKMLAIGIAGIAVVARLWMSWKTHSITEDALITLRYAENIASGRGFVYNPGERVLGTTTPLYTLLLALAQWMHLPAIKVGIICNIFADGLTCYLLARLLALKEIGQPVAGLFAALLYCLSSTPISISIGGMETGLVTCAGMLAITACVRRQSRTLYLIGAVLFMLRIDSLLLFGLLALGLALRERKIPWRSAGLALLATIPWLVFAVVYFGSPVPTSLIAKLTVYSRKIWIPGSFSNTFAFNRAVFQNQFILGWIQQSVTLMFIIGSVVIVSASLARKNFPAHRSSEATASTPAQAEGMEMLLFPLVWLYIYYGTMLASTVPAFSWYFLPPWPVFMATMALGISFVFRFAFQHTLQRWMVGEGRLRTALGQVFLLLACLAGILHLRSIERDIAAVQRQEDNLRAPMGLWLRDHMTTEERVLLEPIGYAGYYSQRRILDMVGLVSPEVLPYYHTPAALSGIVTHLQPEWLCLRQSERDLLHTQDGSLPEGRYELAQPFPSAERPAFLLYHLRPSVREKDSAASPPK